MWGLLVVGALGGNPVKADGRDFFTTPEVALAPLPQTKTAKLPVP